MQDKIKRDVDFENVGDRIFRARRPLRPRWTFLGLRSAAVTMSPTGVSCQQERSISGVDTVSYASNSAQKRLNAMSRKKRDHFNSDLTSSSVQCTRR